MSIVRATLIAVSLLAAQSGFADEGWPQLRHTCYAALLGAQGGTVNAAFRCIRKGTYADLLDYSLIDRNGDEVTGGSVGWGEVDTISVPVVTPGIHVIEVSTGWNVGTCEIAGSPWGYIMTKRLPLQTVGPVERLHFFVPAGVTEFTAFFSASVTREGVRFTLFDPEGKGVVCYDGDADKTEKLTVAVGAGQDGKPWSFSLARPRLGKMALDDVMTWFSDNIPPFACKQPQWPAQLANRGETQ